MSKPRPREEAPRARGKKRKQALEQLRETSDHITT